MVARWLIGSLIKREAGRRAQEAVVDAVKTATQQSGEEAAADDQPCDVGVVCALPQEAGGILDRMQGVTKTHGDGFVMHQGTLNRRRIANSIRISGRCLRR